MKKIILPIIILPLLFVGIALAQETELPDPGLTPDSPFYFLERITERIGTFFTFGDVKKAKRHTVLATERLAEANAMREKGKSELVEKTLERYEDQLEKALFRAEKADTKGEDTKEVAKVITEATYKHLIVLNKALEGVPEEAKPAIERAMTTSVKGHEKAVEVLKMKGALGEVPEGASLPAEIQEEVRERIQRRAQEELEEEKVERAEENDLQSFESFKAFCLEGGAPPEICASLVDNLKNSESLRAFCIEQGGPSEMCEKIPPQGFSFESLEAFCIEMGGTPELCTQGETKCREIGVTTPDLCFLVLSTATVTTMGEVSEE